MKRKSLIMILVVGLIFSAACRRSGFRQPITKFQAAASVVIASTRLYTTELNKVERDHYVLTKLSERSQIRLLELEAVQVFSNQGLKARLDSLDQLAAYGELILKIANSDAPERIRAEATNLGEAIKNLSSTVGQLTNSDDTAFKSAVGPVAKIIGEILGLVVEQKLESALNKAIKQGETPVNELIAVIRNDIQLAYERKRSALSDMRTALVDEYNREQQKGASVDAEKLRIFAERIRAHEDRWEIFATANPGEGLDAMAKAHTALVTYAKSSHKVMDLASLVDAMEAFAARAASIGQAVQALHQL